MIRLLLTLFVCASAAFAQAGATVEFRSTGRVPLHVTLWPGGAKAEAAVIRFAELAANEYRAEITAEEYMPFDTVFTLSAGEVRLIEVALERIATLPEVLVESQSFTQAVLQFGRKEIAASSAPSLAEFLQQSAVDVRSDGVAGAEKTVRIGGSNPNQVLVLVDGRRIQNVGNGAADLSAIPLEWVERVEVYRGGQTTAGGEAIGGVINVITREPNEKSELSGSTTIYETHQRLSVTRAARFGNVGGILSYARLQGPGDYRYTISEDDGTDEFTPHLGQSYRRVNGDIARDQLLIKLTSQLLHDWEFSTTGTLDRANRGMPGYLAPYLTPLARQESEQSAVNARAARAGRHSDWEVRAAYQQAWREYSNPERFAIVKHTEESSREWETEVRGSQRWKKSVWISGAGLGRESLAGEHIAAGDVSRDRWFAWTQLRQGLLREHAYELSGEAGIRAEGFGEDRTALPRFSVTQLCSPSWSAGMVAAWGRSYRAPDFYALFWQEDQAAQGNPELEPEQSTEWTGTVFVETAAKQARIEISASQQKMENLIYWKRTFDNQWKPFNLKKAEVQTLDVMFTQRLWKERIRLQAGGNWTEARDATGDRNTGGKYLTFRPLHSQRTGISYESRGLRVAANYRHISKRAVIETNSKWLSAYQLADLQASYRFRIRHVELEPGAGVENLFNENYRIIRYAPMPGRQWHLSLRLNVL